MKHLLPASPRRRPPQRRARPRLPASPRQAFAKWTPSPAPTPVHANETGGGAGAGAAAVDEKRPLFPALANLLAGHVLRDGEVVLMILKPSRWYILFSAMRFAAAVAIGVIAAELWLSPRAPRAAQWYVAAGISLIAGRMMWSVLQWMGRLYVLTDMRILRLSGVFTVDIFDCPLRKVAGTRVVYSFRERLWRLGSIEIAPGDEASPPGVWQTIRRPAEVHERILAAIHRAKSGGMTEGWD